MKQAELTIVCLPITASDSTMQPAKIIVPSPRRTELFTIPSGWTSAGQQTFLKRAAILRRTSFEPIAIIAIVSGVSGMSETGPSIGMHQSDLPQSFGLSS